MRRPPLVICLVLGLIMGAQPAIADIVVLRNGESYRGTVANREEIRLRSGQFTGISLLPEGTPAATGSLKRFLLREIDYVVLEDPDGGRNVIEFQTLAARSPASGRPRPTQGSDNIATAVGITMIGVGMVSVGALIKFGREEGSEVKKYNGANYCLIAGGAVLFIMGYFSALESGTAQGPDQSAGRFGLALGPTSGGVGIGCTLRF